MSEWEAFFGISFDDDDEDDESGCIPTAVRTFNFDWDIN